MDSKECNTAILLNEGPKSTGDGKNIRNSLLKDSFWWLFSPEKTMQIQFNYFLLECIYTGYVLDQSVVSRAIQTRSKSDCARQCQVLEFCKTFAFSP